MAYLGWEEDLEDLFLYMSDYETFYEFKRYGSSERVDQYDYLMLLAEEEEYGADGRRKNLDFYQAVVSIVYRMDDYKREYDLPILSPYYYINVIDNAVFLKRIQMTDFSSLAELKQKDRALYNYGLKNDLLSNTLVQCKITKRALTLREIKEIAKECSSDREFREKHPKAHQRAKNKRWLSELSLKKEVRLTKYEKCSDDFFIEEALFYDSNTKFRMAKPYLYQLARERNLLETIKEKRAN